MYPTGARTHLKSGEPFANPAGDNHFVIGDLDWLRCELSWVVGAKRWFELYENTTWTCFDDPHVDDAKPVNEQVMFKKLANTTIQNSNSGSKYLGRNCRMVSIFITLKSVATF